MSFAPESGTQRPVEAPTQPTVPADAHAPSGVPPPRLPPPGLAGVVLLALGFVPLLAAFFLDLWDRPLYRFLPVGLVLAALLCWRGWRGLAEAPRPGQGWITGALLFAALCGLAAGTALWSPPLGALAAVVAFVGLAHWQGGWRLLKAWIPAAVILLACLPPPFALDERVLARAQGKLVTMGGHMLGQFGVLHVLHEDRLELVRGAIPLAEACRGLHLSLAAVVVTIFLASWRRRTLAQTALVTLVTPAWVWLAALLGFVFGVKLFAGGGGLLFTGWKGFAVAALLLALIGGLALSVEQLVLFLTVSRRRGVMLEDEARTRAPRQRAPRLAPSPLTWAVAGGFALLGVAQLALGWRAFLPPPRVAEADVPTLAGRQPYTLPEEVGLLRLVPNQALAMEELIAPAAGANVWHYQRGENLFSIALEQPLAGYANVLDDYHAAGWRILLATPRAGGPEGGGPFVEAQMQRDIYQHGRVWFAVADERGQWLAAPPLAGRAREVRARGAPGRTFRVQLFVSSLEPLSATDTDLAVELFLNARQQLAAQCAEHAAQAHARPGGR